ncbi:serine/threonine protein kinase [Herbidospora sp. NEAU-GS84]|uniref:non-specific serine/threonine protein kinase n=1 Tax=Herbidospora solisilvae TaxID=2696284 RepID=A0A7C9JBF2_9ACTN|nr:class IV lanthionine synthetase LanL [Herbidospora solisilvae]NAS25708.1 serine/threonine protein kinase [Herbidospora solisilvae]
MSTGDRHLLRDIAEAVLRRTAEDAPAAEQQTVAGWRVRVDTPWTYLTPVGWAKRAQGWKLHVSATPLSAPVVLARAAEVLGRHRCSFKFASTLEELRGLLSRQTNRGSVGKFITVYPPDDEAAVTLAEELHTATYGLPGPPVLSDRLYRPGSRVHYRFGGFAAPSSLSNDGTYAYRLTAPDGTTVADERNAWYSPPAWARCPFESGQAPVLKEAPEAVLLAGRYVVREAIRHGAKGGVFLAEDRTEGGEVVIKRARPHVGIFLDGRDERDQLRHEARMLELFEPLGVTARKVALFEQDDNVFLVQERLAGTVLTDWRPAGERREAVLRLARRLTELVSAVHAQGYVLRDLTPNNVMITDDGDCLLIDLEMAARPGDPVSPAFTPGYAPPEQVRARWHTPAPGVSADLYALGATLFYLASGCHPTLADDQPAGARSWEARIETLVTTAAARDPLVTALSPLVLGLMREDPERRWDLGRVTAFLREPLPSTAPGPLRLGVHQQERLLLDGLTYTLSTMAQAEVRDPAPRGRLWPVTGFGATADPCAVQHGSAGVLTLLASLLGTDGWGTVQLEACLRDAARWTARRLAAEERPSPGLFFGRAGIAWGLYEAGRALDDQSLRETGLDLALGLPADWPNPDMCHGLAGVGLTALHLWHATGDVRFRDHAHACADTLLRAARRTPDTVLWPIPDDFDSSLAGATHYGFGHGAAGIGAYLLAAGTALGRQDCTEIAVAAGEMLVAAAELRDGAASWPIGPGQESGMQHWCNGASGIGTFLIRLHAATGAPRFRQAAETAAVTVHGQRLRVGNAACHGLAGDGQFLLDLADALDDPSYREQAEELAAVLWARAVVRDGLLVVPDEGGREAAIGWNTGLAGVLDFLHRLRHVGPRPWSADATPTGSRA